MESTDSIFVRSLSQLLRELFDGPEGEMAFLFYPGDSGAHGTLDGVDAATASANPRSGGASIAAHVDHVHFAFSLLNRWTGGEENPWATADWSASWKRGQVTEEGWRDLKGNLREAVAAWREALPGARDWNPISAAGAISSLAHSAYHVGVIRRLLAESREGGAAGGAA